MTPGLGNRIEDVASRPRNDRGVVGNNHEANKDAQPAEELSLGIHAAEGPRRGSTELMANGVLEPKDRDTSKKQSDEIGNKECSPTIGVCNAWESPDITQADRRTDRRH